MKKLQARKKMVESNLLTIVLSYWVLYNTR